MKKIYCLFFLLFSIICSAQSTDSDVSEKIIQNPTVVNSPDFIIYPNPVTTGFITIETKNSNLFKEVSIYDVLGKRVLLTKNISHPIDVTSLKSGVYIINITEIGKNTTRKLVIK